MVKLRPNPVISSALIYFKSLHTSDMLWTGLLNGQSLQNLGNCIRKYDCSLHSISWPQLEGKKTNIFYL